MCTNLFLTIVGKQRDKQEACLLGFTVTYELRFKTQVCLLCHNILTEKISTPFLRSDAVNFLQILVAKYMKD